MKRFLKCKKGVAMAQGVIVIPFFILIWMGMLMLYRIYDTRLEAQSVASLTALKMASAGNCNDAVLNAEDFPGGSGYSIDKTEKGSSFYEEIAGMSPLAIDHTKVKINSKVKKVPKGFGKEGISVSGNRIMTCNTKPANGLMDKVAQMVKKLIKGGK
jgi:hypothetical protein